MNLFKIKLQLKLYTRMYASKTCKLNASTTKIKNERVKDNIENTHTAYSPDEIEFFLHFYMILHLYA